MEDRLFVLNHIQIQDTVTKLYWAFDAHQPDKLRDEVFAKHILVDYTALFGGEPNERSSEELTESWKALMERVEASQHIITGVLPLFKLPLTPESFQGPVNVSANVTAYLRKKASDGRTPESRNGGRIELEVSKEESVENGNPWRVTKLKAIPAWDEGGKEFWQAQ